MASIVASLARQSAAASASLRCGDTVRAQKQMERAIQMCAGYENMHPALSVESARAKISYAAVLSSLGSHYESLSMIKDAQRGLSGVVAWADDCGDEEDPGVAAIGAEARALQCACLVAEGIELESGAGALEMPALPAPRKGQPAVKPLHARLYEEATSLGETRSPAHPVVALARRLQQGSAAFAPDGSGVRGHPSQARLTLPPVKSRTQRQSLIEAMNAAQHESAKIVAEWAAPEEDGALQPSSSSTGKPMQDSVGQAAGAPESASKAGPADSPKRAKKKSQRELIKDAAKKGSDKRDIFKEFLKDIESGKDAMRAGNESWQEDARKRLAQVHRSTKLMLELSNDTELKDKKYSYNGHKVMMHSFLADNRSRSDPQLVKEARRAGLSPEVLMIRKYNKDLYVKPTTPPPTVVKEPVKPKLDEDLASLFRPKA